MCLIKQVCLYFKMHKKLILTIWWFFRKLQETFPGTWAGKYRTGEIKPYSCFCQSLVLQTTGKLTSLNIVVFLPLYYKYKICSFILGIFSDTALLLRQLPFNESRFNFIWDQLSSSNNPVLNVLCWPFSLIYLTNAFTHFVSETYYKCPQEYNRKIHWIHIQ